MWKIRFVVFDHTPAYTPAFILFARTTWIIVVVVIVIIIILDIFQKGRVLARVGGSASQRLSQKIYFLDGWIVPLPILVNVK
jgi:hypothetical protein